MTDGFMINLSPKSCKYLSRRITILVTHLENMKYDMDLMNKSAKLLLDLIYMILISPLT
jgi:hypothetical protein